MVVPAARRSRISETQIRWPRIHGLPKHIPGLFRFDVATHAAHDVSPTVAYRIRFRLRTSYTSLRRKRKLAILRAARRFRLLNRKRQTLWKTVIQISVPVAGCSGKPLPGTGSR